MSLRERGLEPAESVRGTRETTAAAEGVGDIRVHPRCCPLAHASPTLTFSLLGDSHLNVPQEPPCGDELEGTGAAGAVAGGERRRPDAGRGPAADSEFGSALGSQLRSLQTPNLSVLQAETS